MYEKHMGKHTLMVYDNGIKLFVEGLSLEIVDDSSWKKTDEVGQEIGNRYLEYCSEKGHEPHYADYIGNDRGLNCFDYGCRYGQGRWDILLQQRLE